MLEICTRPLSSCMQHLPPNLITPDGKLTEVALVLLVEGLGFDRPFMEETVWKPAGLLLRAFHVSAVVLGPVVVYDEEAVAAFTPREWFNLLVHEQTHRQQQARRHTEPLGWVKFYTEYIDLHLCTGYDNNPLERQAYNMGMPGSSSADIVANRLYDWHGDGMLSVGDLMAEFSPSLPLLKTLAQGFRLSERVGV